MVKFKKRFLVMAVIILLTLSMTGCEKPTNEVLKNTTAVESDKESTQTSSKESESNARETEGQKDTAQGIRIIVDMAGREVEIPMEIEKVYSSNPVGSLIMYTIDDKLMVGLNYDLYEEEKQYTTEYYQNLPNLGGWYGQGKTGNIEELIKIQPNIVVQSGVNETSITSADELQEKLGIPVICINSDFDKLSETYRFLGEIFEQRERCESLAEYCEETIAHASEITGKIKNKVKVYYAEETAGLNTDPAGSAHARLIDLSGGVNVADVEMASGYGRTEVSMEQVIQWDPEVIIACIDNGYTDSGSYYTILEKEEWSEITAVKEGRVYQTPTIPFNWFDRPPSVNTVIGLKWCQAVLYPDIVDYDIKEETKEFYELFYHVTLTDSDVDKILEVSSVE
jgi:iron complex transport system substrate-binding protein